MTVFYVFYLFFCAIYVPGYGDNMIGPGQWNVINVKKCPKNFNYMFEWDIEMRKINRTHSGFNVNVRLDTMIDKTFAIRIDVCKHVDGGCKPYQVFADNNIETFIDKYAKENVIKFLTLAEVDPPYFPVQSGQFGVSNFLFDFNELPIKCLYGEFVAKIFVLKDYVEVSCLEIAVEFIDKHDYDDDYEE